jgi:hypothetical protein
MKPPRAGTTALFIATLVAALTAAAWQLTPEQVSQTAIRKAPVASAVAVCPSPTYIPDTADTVVSAMTPQGLQADPGSLQISTLSGTALAQTTLPSVPLRVAVQDPQAPPVVVTAKDGLAPGLSVDQVTRVSNGDSRGLLGSPCVAPSTDFWFVGGGANVGRRSQLYLTNVDSTPAQVDIAVFSENGRVPAPNARGLVVDAHSRKVLDLAALAPGVSSTAVHVDVTIGRLAAGLLDIQVSGLDPQGADWVPPVAALAKRMVVPGVVDSPDGSRKLAVVAPGDADATVKVSVVAPDGVFTPEGMEAIDVPAGVVREIDLTGVQPASRISVVVDSDVPVIAGVRSVRGPAGTIPEVAYVAGAAPLTAPTALAENRSTATTQSILVLTAPEAKGKVTVATVDADGHRIEQAVDVAAGTTTTVALTGPVSGAAAAYAVVVTPDATSGPVYGTRWIVENGARGWLLTAESLATAKLTVRVPDVRPDAGAGLPGH